MKEIDIKNKQEEDEKKGIDRGKAGGWLRWRQDGVWFGWGLAD